MIRPLMQVFCRSTLAIFLAGGTFLSAQDEPVIEVPKTPSPEDLETYPIFLEGFDYGVQSVLEFDLEIVGFRFVPESEARFRLVATSQDPLGARLFDLDDNPESPIFEKQISGVNQRAQAHALSDLVVTTLTGMPGIAQTKIVFKAELRRGFPEIYVSDYDGAANTHQVTSDGALVKSPKWAPRSQTLYYVSYFKANPDIVSHDLQSGRRRFVARYAGTNMSPAPSPDESKFAFTMSKFGNLELCVANADGSNVVRLTRTRGAESSPTWSPDGSRICFVSDTSGPRLYTISASGGSPVQLKTAGVFNATEPAWSPDGKKIAFTTQTRGGFEICVVPADGGTVERPGIEGEDPSWAPNSRTLIFARRIGGGNKALHLLDLTTGLEKRIPLNHLGSCSEPFWGP